MEPWSTRPGPVARASQPAGRTANPALPIWKSATQQVWKPALQDGEFHWKRRGSHIGICSRLRILPPLHQIWVRLREPPWKEGHPGLCARWLRHRPFFLGGVLRCTRQKSRQFPRSFLPQRNARNSKRRGCVVSSLRSNRSKSFILWKIFHAASAVSCSTSACRAASRAVMIRRPFSLTT